MKLYKSLILEVLCFSRLVSNKGSFPFAAGVNLKKKKYPDAGQRQLGVYHG
jgi:hypothetical protein